MITYQSYTNGYQLLHVTLHECCITLSRLKWSLVGIAAKGVIMIELVNPAVYSGRVSNTVTVPAHDKVLQRVAVTGPSEPWQGRLPYWSNNVYCVAILTIQSVYCHGPVILGCNTGDQIRGIRKWRGARSVSVHSDHTDSSHNLGQSAPGYKHWYRLWCRGVIYWLLTHTPAPGLLVTLTGGRQLKSHCPPVTFSSQPKHPDSNTNSKYTCPSLAQTVNSQVKGKCSLSFFLDGEKFMSFFLDGEKFMSFFLDGEKFMSFFLDGEKFMIFMIIHLQLQARICLLLLVFDTL